MSQQDNKFPPSSTATSEHGSNSAEDTRVLGINTCTDATILQLAETATAPLSSGKLKESIEHLVEGEPISINPATESVSCVAEQPKKNEGNVEFVIGSRYWPGEVLGKGTILKLVIEGVARRLPDPNTNIAMEINN